MKFWNRVEKTYQNTLTAVVMLTTTVGVVGIVRLIQKQEAAL
ncbi:MAG: hypothetical protein ACI8V2_000981 [Candidatus Latescibacterota bacterium]|jgi:hypothetical protein